MLKTTAPDVGTRRARIRWCSRAPTLPTIWGGYQKPARLVSSHVPSRPVMSGRSRRGAPRPVWRIEWYIGPSGSRSVSATTREVSVSCVIFARGLVAEGVGFEPTDGKTRHLISSQARSTTPAPLRGAIYQQAPCAAMSDRIRSIRIATPCSSAGCCPHAPPRRESVICSGWSRLWRRGEPCVLAHFKRSPA